jgi:hypothetical protein
MESATLKACGQMRKEDEAPSRGVTRAHHLRFVFFWIIHTPRITTSATRAERNGVCCVSDEVPVGEGAAPVVRAGVEPEYCSSDFYQQSEKLATETRRHRGNK